MAIDDACPSGNHIEVFTDGAASGNPGPAGWATEINGELHCGSFEFATNNEMEMYAIFVAVEQAPSQSHLRLVTDSQLCVRLLTGQAKSRSNPRLTSLVKSCWAVAREKEIHVDFRLVKGHSTTLGNVRVDRAAYTQSQQAKRERNRKFTN